MSINKNMTDRLFVNLWSHLDQQVKASSYPLEEEAQPVK